MLNMVQIIGHLGAEPEIKNFNNGGRIANLRVATTEKWTDKTTGEKREQTEWHSVTVQSDGLVGVVERFTQKGSKIYACGKLATRKWQDREGNDRYTTEIVVGGFDGKIYLLDGAAGAQGQGQGQGQGRSNWQGSGGYSGQSPRYANSGGAAGEGPLHDDDVPF